MRWSDQSNIHSSNIHSSSPMTGMKDIMASWSVILCSYRVRFNVDMDHNDNQYICVPLCILICFNSILFLLTFFFLNWARSCLMSKQLIQDYESKSVSVQRLSIHLQVAFILPLIYLITLFCYYWGAVDVQYYMFHSIVIHNF